MKKKCKTKKNKKGPHSPELCVTGTSQLTGECRTTAKQERNSITQKPGKSQRPQSSAQEAAIANVQEHDDYLSRNDSNNKEHSTFGKYAIA